MFQEDKVKYSLLRLLFPRLHWPPASLAAPVLGFCSWYKIWGWDRNVSPTEGPSANLPEHVKIMSSVVALTPSLKESFFSLRPSPVPAGMCAASELRNRIFTCRIFVLSDPVRGSGQVTALISVIRDATKILLLTILTSCLSLNWSSYGTRRENMSIILGFAQPRQELRKKRWNWQEKSFTKQRTHKFYESLTHSTAIMSCLTSPEGSR